MVADVTSEQILNASLYASIQNAATTGTDAIRYFLFFVTSSNQDFLLYAIPKPYAINIITNLITVSVVRNVPACIRKTHNTTQSITRIIVKIIFRYFFIRFSPLLFRKRRKPYEIKILI